ncbi:MAG: hypothetical protein LBU92_06155, partial [Prevotellaceae bacterium]|nr:hypothetical protein [Prevotellaceae bacterium]
GLEPPRLSAPDPKSGAATNYAISANDLECKDSTFNSIIQNSTIQNFELCTLGVLVVMLNEGA